MDTVHKLFNRRPLGVKRWWLVLAGLFILAAILRPLLTSSSPAPAPLASSAGTQTQPTPTSAPGDDASPLFRPDNPKPPLPQFRTETSPASLLWRMLLGLVGVLAVIVVGGLLARKYLLARPPAAPGQRVCVLESTRLAPRQTLHLVQAGSKKYLLAGTTEQITLVADVTEAFGKDEPSAP